MFKRLRFCSVTLAMTAIPMWSQEQPSSTQESAGAQQALGQPPGMLGLPVDRATYVLGPGDKISIRALNVEEVGERSFTLDESGYITLPLAGKVKASGITAGTLEIHLMESLKEFVRNPQVAVTITQPRADPVFLVGAFRSPGVYSMQGRRTLLELLIAVGGLQPNASRRIKLTRRQEFGPIPMKNAVTDPSGASSIEISLTSLSGGVNPEDDAVLKPFDTITVEPTELVYVNGAALKTGGFEVRERKYLSVLQVLSMAGGFASDAAPEKAFVLRPVLNTTRRSAIAVNLKNVLNGKANDLPLFPNDTLFIPKRQGAKQFLARSAIVLIPSVITLIAFLVR